MQFITIDVETANADMASVCQIGIVRFVAGAISEEWKTYVDPEDFFDDLNVSIHGIDEQIVAGAPTFREAADRVNAFLDGQVVVTHTDFDRVSLYQAATKCRVPSPNCTWLDSARAARRAWSEIAISGYGLAGVCKRIGYSFKHHDALEDARAAAHIMVAAMTESGLDVEGWLKRVRQPLDPSKADERLTREGNPEGELYGEVLVFTGALLTAGGCRHGSRSGMRSSCQCHTEHHSVSRRRSGCQASRRAHQEQQAPKGRGTDPERPKHTHLERVRFQRARSTVELSARGGLDRSN